MVIIKKYNLYTFLKKNLNIYFVIVKRISKDIISYYLDIIQYASLFYISINCIKGLNFN